MRRIGVAVLAVLIGAGHGAVRAGEVQTGGKPGKAKLSHEQRLAIWRELCAADDRAIWEANRLFDPTDESAKLSSYYEAHEKLYREAVMRRHKITDDDVTRINAEASKEERKPPEFPSFDVVAVARTLKCNVYANTGDWTYHRRNCTLLDAARKPAILPLSRVVGNPHRRACTACAP